MFGRLLFLAALVCVLGMVLTGYVFLSARSMEIADPTGHTAFTAAVAFGFFAFGLVASVYGWLRYWRTL
jgi:hypothetical protein